MSWFKSQGIGIAGISSAVPSHITGRTENTQRFGDKEVDKFIKTTGIREVRRSSIHQTAADLGFCAAEHLLTQLDIDRENIGCLVFVTLSPDYRRPPTSCVLQMRLNLPVDCAALDVGHGCAGFVYGQQAVHSLMAQSDMKYGLLILGETASKVAGENDHSSMIFGDAGAAVLYERKENSSCTSCNTVLRSDGSGYRAIILPAGGFRDINPEREAVVCSDGVSRTKYDLFMDGMAVLSFSISRVPEAVREFLEVSGTKIADYDLFAFHQANSFILRQLIKRLSLPQEKVPISMDRYGNTSSVSIPLTICDCYGGKASGTKKVLASGFGVGLAWGVTDFEVDAAKVFPVIETDEYFAAGRIDLQTL